jgi:hypothetical protein
MARPEGAQAAGAGDWAGLAVTAGRAEAGLAAMTVAATAAVIAHSAAGSLRTVRAIVAVRSLIQKWIGNDFDRPDALHNAGH